MTDTVTSQSIELSSWNILYRNELVAFDPWFVRRIRRKIYTNSEIELSLETQSSIYPKRRLDHNVTNECMKLNPCTPLRYCHTRKEVPPPRPTIVRSGSDEGALVTPSDMTHSLFCCLEHLQPCNSVRLGSAGRGAPSAPPLPSAPSCALRDWMQGHQELNFASLRLDCQHALHDDARYYLWADSVNVCANILRNLRWNSTRCHFLLILNHSIPLIPFIPLSLSLLSVLKTLNRLTFSNFSCHNFEPWAVACVHMWKLVWRDNDVTYCHYSWLVHVAYKTGFGLDDWIYLHLLYSTHNYM
jgi:hypothetical protein